MVVNVTNPSGDKKQNLIEYGKKLHKKENAKL